jgi:hypothetical protein
VSTDSLHATIDGDVVRVLLGASLKGTGRFADGCIEHYDGAPLGETPEAHEAALACLAARLLEQAREELAAMQRDAYDEDGVDVSLIRWMLSLTPRERLRAVDDHSRSLARMLPDELH